MKAKELMTKSVIAVLADLPVREAAVCMKEYRVGILPVCDEPGLCGVITDRDIVTRVLALGRDPDQTSIREAMTRRPVYCNQDEDIEDVARIMELERVRRLPVLSGKDGLVGMISLTDLAARGHADALAGGVAAAASLRQA